MKVLCTISSILFCLPGLAATISGSELTLLYKSRQTQGTCPDSSYTIPFSSDMLNYIYISQSAECFSGTKKAGFKESILFGDKQTLCDNGYPKNDSCISYVSFGYQPNFYNLNLDSTLFVQPTNNTCDSNYHSTTTQPHYFEQCMAAGTQIQLTWEGVDVTGTDAASCYYLGDLYAPTTAPTNVPQGYKFLGWRPKSE